jgi:hypothetical protein
MGLAPKVVTRTGAELPSDGGIVVIAEPKQGGKLDPGDAAIPKSWRFKGNAGEPTFVSLAPGLAVVKLPKDASGRTISGELFDGKTALVAVKATDKLTPILPAPSVQSIVEPQRVSRRVRERVTVKLDSQPAGAIAVVLAEPGKNGKPRSYGLIPNLPGGGKTSIEVDAYAHHECQALPNGTVPSKPGDLVVVMFVDELGRLSAPSKPFKIAAAPTP